jgi:hypothetical protein
MPTRRWESDLPTPLFSSISLTNHQRFPGMIAFMPDDHQFTLRQIHQARGGLYWHLAPAPLKSSTARSPYLDDLVFDIVEISSQKPGDLLYWDLTEEQIA